MFAVPHIGHSWTLYGFPFWRNAEIGVQFTVRAFKGVTIYPRFHVKHNIVRVKNVGPEKNKWVYWGEIGKML